MGLSFKENCPDIRNTRVVDIIRELREYGCDVDVYDPVISTTEARQEYGLNPIDRPLLDTYMGIIVAVAHNEFRDMGAETIRSFGHKKHVLYDLKYIFPASSGDIRL